MLKPTTEDVLKWVQEIGVDPAVYKALFVRHSNGSWIGIEDVAQELAALAYAAGAAAEREAIADAVIKCDSRATLKGIAVAIRARSEE